MFPPTYSPGEVLELTAGILAPKFQKTITFDGTAGNGATGSVALFTVHGTVLATIRAFVLTTPTGASATIAHGISGATAILSAAVTATSLVQRTKALDSTGIVTMPAALNKTPGVILLDGEIVIATIATANIATGKLQYILDVVPLTVGAYVS